MDISSKSHPKGNHIKMKHDTEIRRKQNISKADIEERWIETKNIGEYKHTQIN